MISNAIASVYFIILILRKGEESDICLDPRYYSVKQGIPREVVLVGLPSSLMNMMAVLSNITLNKLMSSYTNAAVAGLGVAKKVDMIAFAVATGMSQGVLPLIAYNYAAGNYRRMKRVIRFDFILSFSIAVAEAVLLFTCAAPIVRAFIDDAETIRYGQLFQRIICLTAPFISITMLSITCFQSVGKKLEPSILSLLRKGGLDIPFMFIMNAMFGIEGIVWATPIADLVATTVAVILFVPYWRHLTARMRETEAMQAAEGA